jgi:putative phosphoserine phosphatase/1-acylglycerol-3-phosphate O-acyltransferase
MDRPASVRELRLPGSVAEIRASPEGPGIGAFFDVDGTLVAGFTASVHTKDRLQRREVGAGELLRGLQLGLDYRLGRVDFERLIARGTRELRGRSVEDLDEMGERLFQQRIVDLIYPEMRELVRAHHDRGHRVLLSSSALPNQVEPIARYLGIETVLCNRFETDADGVLTGEVVRPIVYGPSKSEVVQGFAREHGLDLRQSYFYADGDEDLPLMYAVGHPRPTNPGRRMAHIAQRRGWPVLNFASRGSQGLQHRLRSVVGVAALAPISAAAVSLGVLTRNRRRGVNLLTDQWPNVFLRINGVHLNVHGEDNLTKDLPAVFIFNHRNNFDPIFAAALIRNDYTGVAKKELQSNPILNAIGKVVDVAFIDRSDTSSSVAALDTIQDKLADGISILIAPEGTRIDTASVGPFKKGAFWMAMNAGVPIVPIVFRNAELVAGRNGSSLNPGTVDVAVLAPISTQDWSMRGFTKNVAAVRQRYVDTLADWPQ